MVTEDGPQLQRRQVLAGLVGLAAAPSLWAGSADAIQLLAAWQQGNEQHIGLLKPGTARLEPGPSLRVPTRAHGLMAERSGAVLAVARRPGDWLLRWLPHSGATQWMWATDNRRFNGHVIASADGQRLWTTETDLDTAQGLLGCRDANSLETTAEWPTHGLDPHQLLALPQDLGPWPAGTLMVANGGIPTLPETGRQKHQLDRMDASLVALHPQTGERLGQWRLADPFLSIRHLAWDPVSSRLGIALQAEHPDTGAKATAPVLAVWDGQGLVTAHGQPGLEGYGGDICALPGGGFAVSCPRAGQLAVFHAEGTFQRLWPQASVCALATQGQQWWSSGRDTALRNDGAAHRSFDLPAGQLQFDNHWQVLAV